MTQRDPDLLERLKGLDKGAFEGVAYRVVWSDRSAVQGSSGSGGRWNDPARRFEILNTSLERDGAAAEFEAFWSLFEQRPDRRASSWKLKLRLKRVVELGFEELERLGIGRGDFGGREYARTQEIAEALNRLACDGLIVPSARYEGKNLIVFTENLDKDCVVEAVESVEFSWRD